MALDPTPRLINPLALPDYPLARYRVGDSGAYPYGWLQGVRRDFREAADPTVLYEPDAADGAGRYILYSSAGMAWTSTDRGATWARHFVEPNDIGYAPTIVKHAVRGETNYLLTACHASIWIADDPLGPFTELGPIRRADGEPLEPAEDFFDPMLFSDVDADGRPRLYVYWGLAGDGIKGVELDPDDPTRAVTDRAVMFAYDPGHEWERFGEFNEDPSKSYVEGPWMLRETVSGKPRYFLTYTAPGTEFATYGMGAYVADAPLGPFAYQAHNPICQSRSGLIRGAGHGCIVAGHPRENDPRDGNHLWCFFTCGAQVTHNFERRVGMAPAFLDGDGNLRVDPVDELPLDIGTGRHAEQGGRRLLPVNRAKPVRPSSVSPGREPIYAVDGDLRTWWQPDRAAEDPRPSLESDFNARFTVSAVRIAWTEPGLDVHAGAAPAPIPWRLELRDGEEGQWLTVLTNTGDNAGEHLIDARAFSATPATHARLSWDAGAAPYALGVADLTLFGVLASWTSFG